jgi:hypothetical protein
MAQETDNRPEPVACELCKKHIAPSEALSSEAHAYVLYFCGAECRAQWEREQAQGVEQTFREKSGVKPD